MEDEMSMTKAQAEAIEERRMTCADCGCAGVRVDTDAGEIVVDGQVVASVEGETMLMASASGDRMAVCDGCEDERVAAETVVCTGCGVRLAVSAGHCGDHADTYSGTTWHCAACWARCEAPAAEAE